LHRRHDFIKKAYGVFKKYFDVTPKEIREAAKKAYQAYDDYRNMLYAYGHKALKMLSKLTGKPISNMDIEHFGVEDIEKIMFAGLKADDPSLELKDMENLLDTAQYGYIVKTMGEAINAAFGGNEKNEVGTAQSLEK
jgi:predicted nucleotide-binding protein (sugar kinase/HSP70/actin superfamily)